MSTIAHPSIGTVTGVPEDGCVQFLGIKYAVLKDMFATAEPVQYNQSGIDATKYGPQVVSPPIGVDIELGFIQRELPKPESPGISDVDGLNLNITVPSVGNKAGTAKGLPVLAYIHGGGYALGGNSWPQYNMAKLAKISADLGQPVIIVNINYRLGCPGFLTSPELRAAGYRPNNGLRDQRAALRWIKKYIGGFGGDPDSVTVMGQSAGGVSTGYLLFSDEPLARQLVCLGGCPPLLGQLPIEAADQISKQVFKLLGLQDVPADEIVQRLLETPVTDFLTKIPPTVPSLPVIDGDILPTAFTYKTLEHDIAGAPGAKWVDRILMGYSKLDGSIMAYMGLLARKEGIAAAFQAQVAKSLSDFPEIAKSLLEHYSLSESLATNLTNDEALLKILKFITDISFFVPAIKLAQKFPKPSYVLSFNEPNPWDGPFKGQASHILDVAFLFQNYNEHLNSAQRAAAEKLGADVISFVNGVAPWKEFNGREHGIASYENGERKYCEMPHSEEIGWSDFMIELVQNEKGPGMERLVQGWKKSKPTSPYTYFMMDHLLERARSVSFDKPGEILSLLLFVAGGLFVAYVFYLGFFHPLRNIPGPFLARYTELWRTVKYFKGDWHDDIVELHRRYGPVVRVSPNEVSIVDKNGLAEVYGHGKGTRKTSWYHTWNTPSGDFSFFNATQPHQHSFLRKRVAGIYSMSSLLALEREIGEVEDAVWEKFDKFAKQRKPINMHDWASYFAFDIVGRLTLGAPIGFVKTEKDNLQLIKAIHTSFYQMSNMGYIPGQTSWVTNWFSRLFLKVVTGGKIVSLAEFEKWAFEQIMKRLNEPKGTDRRRDMLDHFIDMKEPDGSKATLKSVFLEVANIIGAGADTTSIGVRTVLAQLISHPEHYLRVREEVDDAFAKGFTKLEHGEVPYAVAEKLPFLNACAKEALRLHPSIVWQLPRETPASGINVAGHYIAPGTTLSISPVTQNRDKSVFGPDAENWNPERWIPTKDRTEADIRQMDKYNTTFGYGARICIGRNLAMIEILKFVAGFVRRYDVEYVNKERPFVVKSQWFSYQEDMYLDLKLRQS